MPNRGNLLLLATSLVVSLALAEGVSRVALATTWAEFSRIDERQSAFYYEYASRLHHLRHPSLPYIESETDFLFTAIRPFGNGELDLLFQGDSWFESIFWQVGSRERVTRFASDLGAGLTLAGIPSYAPSPMTLQLEILRTDFRLRPTVIVAYIDQSDLGDEICRYRGSTVRDGSGRIVRIMPEPHDSGEFASFHRFFAGVDAVASHSWGITKALALARQAARYRRDPSLLPLRCGWDRISAPLVHGPSPEERTYFISAVGGYIDTVFSDPDVRQLLLVTHPHRGHTSLASDTPYAFDVAELVRSAAAQSPHADKIELLDFSASFEADYPGLGADEIFLPGDPASHLVEAAHSEVFIPKLLAHLEDILARSP